MAEHGDGLRVVVDTGRNMLRLLIPRDDAVAPTGTAGAAGAPAVRPRAAILDVGEAGRLLGLEVGDDPAGGEPWYLDLEDAPGSLLRSVPVTVEVASDRSGQPVWVDLPRRGDGYELTFPIGNQCWVRPRRRPA